jgi:signal peptidase I
VQDSTRKEVYSWIKSFIFAIILSFICQKFLFTPVTVQGESMMPTFENNNKVVVSKISEIERFDMIVFHSPISEDNHIKRVIGLPGDKVEVKDDVLYINGVKREEPYLKSNKEQYQMTLTQDFATEVPDHSLFVMGDNRLKSGDSRYYGFISYDAVIGEVKFRYYPFREIGIPR